METRHCHKCGWTWDISGLPGRGDTCHGCRADLRVCLNCLNHDLHAAEECRERRADLVQDKDRSNFCEYFDMAQRVYRKNGGANPSREDRARDELKRLLGG